MAIGVARRFRRRRGSRTAGQGGAANSVAGRSRRARRRGAGPRVCGPRRAWRLRQVGHGGAAAFPAVRRRNHAAKGPGRTRSSPGFRFEGLFERRMDGEEGSTVRWSSGGTGGRRPGNLRFPARWWSELV
ncbi:hypothetical protein GQ55_2G090000 [Panicum hallii var. hallii]|uniref:Uncharacterized protein n=1 Tax=Panicum hallii var. hallii TaxID=1504633 RepID=A0A2T7EMZ6_9POAL|nr:hypothetical protein GQ55_2G090000 [Panicum hallii var. hallii]